jgi:hypothetical protein
MSVGHSTNSKYGADFVQSHISIYTDPIILQEMAKPFLIYRNYDIPYVAGYNKRGDHFYIDRHLPRFLRAGKKTFETKMVINHERMEAAIIHKYGWEYEAAHAMAEHYEDTKYTEAGLDAKLVEQAYKSYIKADEHEKLKICPKDLDLTPYYESRDFKLVRAIQKAQ